MLKNQFRYSNFLLYTSGLTRDKDFFYSEINYRDRIDDLNLDSFPTFKKYFNETFLYELHKSLNLNNWMNEAKINTIEPLSYLSRKKSLLKIEFIVVKDCEIYKANYEFDRIMYFEFSKGIDLDDYFEKVIKVESYYMFKFDFLSKQDIEIKLNKIQRLIIGLIKGNSVPLGDLISYVTSGDLIPGIKWSRYHKIFVLNQLIPLIYWGFIIPKNISKLDEYY